MTNASQMSTSLMSVNPFRALRFNVSPVGARLLALQKAQPLGVFLTTSRVILAPLAQFILLLMHIPISTEFLFIQSIRTSLGQLEQLIQIGQAIMLFNVSIRRVSGGVRTVRG